uniref:Serine protease K12H4.7 n=1 Tax=Panagrellus redivivus TaxID=6233 RepID=A0A7E4W0T9_PANRE
MKSVFAVLAILTVLCVAIGDANPLKPLKLYLSQRRPGRDACPDPDHPVGINLAQEQYFVQFVDQVGKTEPLQQRFWQNDQWYKPGGPQFLMLAGEATASSAWVERDDLEWTSLAKEVGARVFLLEHRFYGKSQPSNFFPGLFTPFDYLNSQQAAADVVAFITGQNGNLNITNPRWILFGGSYAGALAAWIREKHPDSVYAAVASSAPVQAVVNFKSYLEGVYNVLHSYDPKCAESVRKGFYDFNRLLQTPLGRMSLQSTFRLCNDITNIDNNTQSFIYQAILEGYERVVQFSEINVGDYATKLTIPELCKRQLGADSDLDGLVSINNWMLFEDFESCLDTDYHQYILDLQNGYAGRDDGDYRAWFYQQCNEFGFFRSTDSDFVSNQFPGADVPIDYYLQQCQLVMVPYPPSEDRNHGNRRGPR